MNIKYVFTLALLLCNSWMLIAQEYQQNIRGSIVDKDSQNPLIGANIRLLETVPIIGTSTDLDGYFKLENVSVGRLNIEVTYLGYEPVLLNNVLLTTGKELVLNIEMTEASIKMNEVVVVAKQDKKKAINQLASVSSRTFSVEETSRYAAGQFDPARMAQSFAGVGVGGGDGLSNEIVIRGNSPKGVLWRLEGIEIPNPNHFGSIGNSSGSISMLSSTILNNSDFYTGAFPAEFGNALSGVFDLRMRKGNNEKREHAFMIGLLGIEAGIEGPFRKGGRASYLLNYRYSTLDVLNSIGINLVGDTKPKYQDLSFKVNLPTRKAGLFSIFALAGINESRLTPRDSSEWALSDDREGFVDKQSVGTLGLSHRYLLSDNSYVHSVASVSLNRYSEFDYFFNLENNDEKTVRFDETLNSNSARLSSYYNRKLNARNTIRTGFVFNHMLFDYQSSSLNPFTFELENHFSNKGSSQLLQVYGHWKHRMNNLTINSGLHYAHLFFNNTFSVEPRLALEWKISNRNALSVAAGLHSKMDNLGLYIVEGTLPNGAFRPQARDLKLSKAFHAVLGYDFYFNEFIRMKIETYYQRLFDLPISSAEGSVVSAINAEDIYDLINLINPNSNGTGYNYGVDLTFEKFFSSRYYYLITGSLYRSKFVPNNGQTYSTNYDGNYQLNLLLGKEWAVGRKKQSIFGLNSKFVIAGGRRTTPVDRETSQLTRTTVYDFNLLNTDRYPTYYRFDLSFSYKINKAKTTHTFLLELQNVSNKLNIETLVYNLELDEMHPVYQVGFIPNFC
ncbi:MAG: TonB-dependent receptor [Bacteroidota bacterium]